MLGLTFIFPCGSFFYISLRIVQEPCIEKRFSPYIQPGAMLGLTFIFPCGSFFYISLRIVQDPLYRKTVLSVYPARRDAWAYFYISLRIVQEPCIEKRFSPYIQPGAMLGLTFIFPCGSFFYISLRIVQDPLYRKTVLSVYPARRDAWAYFYISLRIVKRLFFRST